MKKIVLVLAVLILSPLCFAKKHSQGIVGTTVKETGNVVKTTGKAAGNVVESTGKAAGDILKSL